MGLKIAKDRWGQTPLEILSSPKRSKFLTGQTAAEYMMIFAVVAALSMFGIAAFYTKVHNMTFDFFRKSAVGIMGVAPGELPPVNPVIGKTVTITGKAVCTDCPGQPYVTFSVPVPGSPDCCCDYPSLESVGTWFEWSVESCWGYTWVGWTSTAVYCRFGINLNLMSSGDYTIHFKWETATPGVFSNERTINLGHVTNDSATMAPDTCANNYACTRNDALCQSGDRACALMCQCYPN